MPERIQVPSSIPTETAKELTFLRAKRKPAGEDVRMMTGNEACAHGALAAGLTFFAGYPITPSSEVAEVLSYELPKRGGVFIQMEDEIASAGAIIGASLTGAKSMTATSGPGFSLMQETIGYASMTEVPVVIVNVMRGGPSTGQPTMTSQSDLMQARWGTHGDHSVIVLTPYTVREVFDLTVRAFNLSERFRVPVVMLFDETLAHVNERITMPDPSTITIVDRARPTCPPEEYLPYEHTKTGVPAMADFGSGYRYHVTGLTHDETGFPTNSTQEAERLLLRLHGKLEQGRKEIVDVDTFMLDDAEIGVVAYGASARSAHDAVRTARKEGIRVGLFRPKTIWPFPDEELRHQAARIQKWLVVEMSMGQLRMVVEWTLGMPVTLVRRFDGVLIHPLDIVNKLRGLNL